MLAKLSPPPLSGAKLVPLGVAPELHLHVEAERVGAAEVVDLDGVVDHEVGGNERLYARDVTSALHDCRAHRGQVDEQGYAGEVLQQHAPHDERDLRLPLCVRLPARERFDVLVADAAAVAIAQDRLEEDAEADRQPRDACDPPLFEKRERVVHARGSRGQLETPACVEHGVSRPGSSAHRRSPRERGRSGRRLRRHASPLRPRSLP